MDKVSLEQETRRRLNWTHGGESWKEDKKTFCWPDVGVFRVVPRRSIGCSLPRLRGSNIVTNLDGHGSHFSYPLPNRFHSFCDHPVRNWLSATNVRCHWSGPFATTMAATKHWQLRLTATGWRAVTQTHACAFVKLWFCKTIERLQFSDS